MRIKIISDGISMGTHVVNAETGEEIKGVTKVEWSIGVGELSRVKLEFVHIPAEAEGIVDDAMTVADCICGASGDQVEMHETRIWCNRCGAHISISGLLGYSRGTDLLAMWNRAMTKLEETKR